MAEDGGGGGGRGGWSRGVRRGNTLEVTQEDRGGSLFWVKVFMVYWLYQDCIAFVVHHILYSPGSVQPQYW